MSRRGLLDSYPVENDCPYSRGSDWHKRSDEIQERDNHTCQAADCGRSKGEKRGRRAVVLETHHIVRGKYLPADDARVGLNLITLCERDHGRFEGEPPRTQFEMAGKDDVVTIFDAFRDGWSTMQYQRNHIDLSEGRIDDIVDGLVAMRCLIHKRGTQYRVPDPAVTRAAYECLHRKVATMEDVRGERDELADEIESLEAEMARLESENARQARKLDDLRQELNSIEEQTGYRTVRIDLENAYAAAKRGNGHELRSCLNEAMRKVPE